MNTETIRAIIKKRAAMNDEWQDGGREVLGRAH